MHGLELLERLERVDERADARFVCDNVQGSAVAVLVLQQARDRDVMSRELLGDLLERAGPVLYIETKVVRRTALAAFP